VKARSLLVLGLVAPFTLSGCDDYQSGPQRPTSEQQQDSKQQRLAELNRQKADALYEIQLRQDEMKEMEATVRKPGIVGVSHEWLERHNRLKEEIIKLRVKVHDLELQMDDLAKP
jgi:hypothetical protein